MPEGFSRNFFASVVVDVMCQRFPLTCLLFSVLASLLLLIEEPEPEHPLRPDVAEEYTKDKRKFMKNAEDQTKKYAEKRDS